MIIVKLTVLAVMVTVLYIWIWRAWLKTNPEEALKNCFQQKLYSEKRLSDYRFSFT